MSKILADQIANYDDNGPIEIKEGLNIASGKPIQIAGSAGSNGNVLVSNGTTVSWSNALDNSSNWDTAFGWGNHASAGYLVSSGSNLTLGDLELTGGGSESLIRDTRTTSVLKIGADKLWLQNKDGNEPYLEATDNGSVKLYHNFFPKLETTATGITVTGEIITDGGNSTDWNTAHGWGNHASAGYLTSVPALALDGLSNVDATTGVANGSIIKYNGASWEVAPDLNDNTTYVQSAQASGGNVNLRLTGSDATNDDILITAGTNVTFSSVTVNGFTIDAAGGGGGSVGTLQQVTDAGNTTNTAVTFDNDVQMSGNSYNLLWDKSNNSLEFNDEAQAKFGTNGDLKISHTMSLSGQNDSTGASVLSGNDWCSFIAEAGTGGLVFKSNGGHGSKDFQFFDSSWRPILRLFGGATAKAVLYYGGAQALEYSATALTIGDASGYSAINMTQASGKAPEIRNSAGNTGIQIWGAYSGGSTMQEDIHLGTSGVASVFQDLNPKTDSTYDLGTTTLRWQKVYADAVDTPSTSQTTSNGTNGINLTTSTSGANANAIEFQTDNNTASAVRWRFTPPGHLLPSTNAAYDIGSAEYKVRHLFLSDNTLYFEGDFLKVAQHDNGGSAQSASYLIPLAKLKDTLNASADYEAFKTAILAITDA